MIETPKPPYAVMIVGALPSNFRFFGRTTKYGTFVPSFDVAKRCSTRSFEASNFGEVFFATVSVPESTLASNSVEGVKKPVTVRNALAPERWVEPSRIAELAGTSSFFSDQSPRRSSLYVETRPCTLWYETTTTRSRVVPT